MRNTSLIFIVCISFFFAFSFCNKGTNSTAPRQVKYHGQEEFLMDPPPPNYNYFPFVLVSAPDPDAGKYRCMFNGGPTITITQPIYQLTCPPDEMPVNVRNGIPCWTETMTATPNCSVELIPSTVGGDNHFIVVMGTFLNDLSAIRQDVVEYNTALYNYYNNVMSGGVLLQPYLPYLGDFVNSTYPNGAITYRGKLIRTTSGSGFALAFDSYPAVETCLNPE